MFYFQILKERSVFVTITLFFNPFIQLILFDLTELIILNVKNQRSSTLGSKVKGL